jgi:hypothetical protein
MSDAGNAVKNPPAAKTTEPDAGPNRVAELKVSGHLMTLDAGMFCIFHAPGSPTMDDGSGLPGVRITLPPAPADRPDAVRISTFREDGWLDFSDGAALVRVEQGPAQVLVTVYQSPAAAADTAPRLQVLRLTPDATAPVRPGAPGPGPVAPAGAPASGRADLVAHVQRTGDVAAEMGTWIGTRGSGSWIEGFAINPPEDLTADDLEYQAVLGRGWLSPWIEGGKFCGSRGMALPLLGLNVRLRGDAAKTHECTYFATFVDGTSVGPVPAGEACQTDSLAALEAFQVVLRRRGAAAAPTATAPRTPAPTALRAPAVATRPAAPRATTPVTAAPAKAPAPAPKPTASRAKSAAPKAKSAPVKHGVTRAPLRTPPRRKR